MPIRKFRDVQTGRVVTFEWNQPQDPTDADIELAAKQYEPPPGLEPKVGKGGFTPSTQETLGLPSSLSTVADRAKVRVGDLKTERLGPVEQAGVVGRAGLDAFRKLIEKPISEYTGHAEDLDRRISERQAQPALRPSGSTYADAQFEAADADYGASLQHVRNVSPSHLIAAGTMPFGGAAQVAGSAPSILTGASRMLEPDASPWQRVMGGVEAGLGAFSTGVALPAAVRQLRDIGRALPSRAPAGVAPHATYYEAGVPRRIVPNEAPRAHAGRLEPSGTNAQQAAETAAEQVGGRAVDRANQRDMTNLKSVDKNIAEVERQATATRGRRRMEEKQLSAAEMKAEADAYKQAQLAAAMRERDALQGQQAREVLSRADELERPSEFETLRAELADEASRVTLSTRIQKIRDLEAKAEAAPAGVQAQREPSPPIASRTAPPVAPPHFPGPPPAAPTVAPTAAEQLEAATGLAPASKAAQGAASAVPEPIPGGGTAGPVTGSLADPEQMMGAEKLRQQWDGVDRRAAGSAARVGGKRVGDTAEGMAQAAAPPPPAPAPVDLKAARAERIRAPHRGKVTEIPPTLEETAAKQRAGLLRMGDEPARANVVREEAVEPSYPARPTFPSSPSQPGGARPLPPEPAVPIPPQPPRVPKPLMPEATPAPEVAPGEPIVPEAPMAAAQTPDQIQQEWIARELAKIPKLDALMHPGGGGPVPPGLAGARPMYTNNPGIAQNVPGTELLNTPGRPADYLRQQEWFNRLPVEERHRLYKELGGLESERRKLIPDLPPDPTGGGGEEGFIAPEALLYLTKGIGGGMAGQEVERQLAGDTPLTTGQRLRGTAIGALAGVAMPTPAFRGIGKTGGVPVLREMERISYENMLAGAPQVANVAGNTASMTHAPWIEAIRTGSLNPLKAQARALANPRELIRNLGSGIREGWQNTTLPQRDFANDEVQNAPGYMARTLQGADQGTQNVMRQMEIPEDMVQTYTFKQNPRTKMGGGIAQMLSGTPLRAIEPFHRTALSLMEQGAAMSPLRFADMPIFRQNSGAPLYQQGRGMRNVIPATSRATDIALAVPGTAAFGLGLSGVLPHGPIVNAAFGPLSFPYAVGAGLHDYAQYDNQDSSTLMKGVDLTRAVSQQLPFIGTIPRIVEGTDRFGRSMATRLLPQFTMMFGDKTVRDPENIGEAIMERVPWGGARESLPVKRDFFGEPLQRNMLGQYPDPIYKRDPRAAALAEMGLLRREQSPALGATRDLSGHEQSRLQELRGKTMIQVLDPFLRDPSLIGQFPDAITEYLSSIPEPRRTAVRVMIEETVPGGIPRTQADIYRILQRLGTQMGTEQFKQERLAGAAQAAR